MDETEDGSHEGCSREREHKSIAKERAKIHQGDEDVHSLLHDVRLEVLSTIAWADIGFDLGHRVKRLCTCQSKLFRSWISRSH
jgi:hypothetical protein